MRPPTLSGFEANTAITITVASMKSAPIMPPGLRFTFFISGVVLPKNVSGSRCPHDQPQHHSPPASWRLAGYFNSIVFLHTAFHEVINGARANARPQLLNGYKQSTFVFADC